MSKSEKEVIKPVLDKAQTLADYPDGTFLIHKPKDLELADLGMFCSETQIFSEIATNSERAVEDLQTEVVNLTGVVNALEDKHTRTASAVSNLAYQIENMLTTINNSPGITKIDLGSDLTYALSQLKNL